jgi:hypothetical protein
VCGANAQSVTVEHLDDFRGKHSFQWQRVRVLPAKVTEDLPAAANHFPIVQLLHFQHLLESRESALDQVNLVF